MQQVLILKFALGPEKLPGLSRNRHLDGDKYRSFIDAEYETLRLLIPRF